MSRRINFHNLFSPGKWFETMCMCCVQFGRDWKTMTAYPFIFHSISLSLFASVIGPFGGFFASGFKRAFRIKVSSRCICLFLDVAFFLVYW